MLWNFLKIAWRNLTKNKFQSLILIGGLAVGMATCILLLQYVSYELSFDNFHTGKDQIYRVVNERFQNGRSVQKGTITYPTIGPALKAEFPEIKNATRIAYSSDVMLTSENLVYPTEPGLWVDQEFLKIFDFPTIARSEDVLLKKPNEILLTRQIAQRIFPDLTDYQSLLGKPISIDRYPDPFVITGILENVPTNSTLQFEVLLSYASCIRYWGEGADNSWVWSDFYHYLLLDPHANVQKLKNKFAAFSERHFRGDEVSGSQEVFSLQPLSRAHLYSSGLEYEIGETSNGKAVWSMLTIAFFILLVAWINYVNLSSVRAIERAGEVGVRKVVGASRFQLIRQFLLETLLINLLSLVLALAVANLLFPWFALNFEINRSAIMFATGSTTDLFLWASLIFLLATGILLSGIYPAMMLSTPHISSVLKGNFLKNLSDKKLRKGLVVFQFTLSIALISVVILVSKQIRFISTQDLGVNIEQILTINSPELTEFDSTFIDKTNTLKNALVKIPGIISATTSNRTPGERTGRVFQIRKVGEGNTTESHTSNFINVDFNYAETYGLEPLAGRFFRREDHHTDYSLVNKIVISQATAEKMGYASLENAVDRKLNFWDRDWTIVGVIPDFHQRSLHHQIEPLILLPSYSPGNTLSLRISTSGISDIIDQVESTYAQFFPGNDFNYEFLDDRYAQLYEADVRFGKILSFFTILTILIAGLGLFGLSYYSILQRTKEIGVRKILGATTWNIITLINKDFVKLILVSIVLAAPISWYFITRWLNQFAYQTNVAWWLFILAGLFAVIIALITVSFHSLKAATANPARALKDE